MKKDKKSELEILAPMAKEEYVRLANNFYNSKGLDSYLPRIEIDKELGEYINSHRDIAKKRYKVAFLWICLNPPYWEFAKQMIDGAKKFFLPGHDVDYLLWSDMPKTKEEVISAYYGILQQTGAASVVSVDPSGKGVVLSMSTENQEAVKRTAQDVEAIHSMDRVTVYPTESIEWPMPTLMRYHTFLQQEEKLKEYDYIFYCDVDMSFVDIIGDEILGDGLTTGVNPMYYLDKSMYPPYEPNPASAAYIPRPGRLIHDGAQPRFQPLYYAGGFQGGKTEKFIEAMKVMKERIDYDFSNNYIAIWNEESHWNKYLFENPPSVVLNPSYIYPDSLHNEYYIPRWGRNYQPKLVTLTKKFSLRPLSPQEIESLRMMQK